MNIGLFGGTFDPPHIGHLIAAQDACTALALDRMLFVPAAVPPHKRNVPVSDANVRLAMLEAAVANNDAFVVCKLELERAGPSYTVETLRELKTLHPNYVLHLLLGADQIRDFGTWREPDEVARLARVVMLARGNVEGMESDVVAAVVPVTRIDVSSTAIRRRVAANQPIHYMVPPAVLEIIEREGLYARADGGPAPAERGKNR